MLANVVNWLQSKCYCKLTLVAEVKFRPQKAQRNCHQIHRHQLVENIEGVWGGVASSL